MKIDPNSPAFANEKDPGLTIRAHFAAMAMQGILSGGEQAVPTTTVADAARLLEIPADQYHYATHYPMLVAKCATLYADALIAALNKEGK